MKSKTVLVYLWVVLLVFALAVDGHAQGGGYAVIRRFIKNTGYEPYGGLVQTADGTLYGTTTTGGAGNSGILFKIPPHGDLITLHAFDNETEGQRSLNALTLARDGCFYGTNLFGGSGNGGTVYQMTPAGVLTVLHSFEQGSRDDGSGPDGHLAQGDDGNFYGTTRGGGDNDLGTVYRLTPEGDITLLHSFAGGADGQTPFGGLIQGRDGSFYGTTIGNSKTADKGTVFKITEDRQGQAPGRVGRGGEEDGQADAGTGGGVSAGRGGVGEGEDIRGAEVTDLPGYRFRNGIFTGDNDRIGGRGRRADKDRCA